MCEHEIDAHVYRDTHGFPSCRSTERSTFTAIYGKGRDKFQFFFVSFSVFFFCDRLRMYVSTYTRNRERQKLRIRMPRQVGGSTVCLSFLLASACSLSIFLRSLVCLCHSCRCSSSSLYFSPFLSPSLSIFLSIYTQMCTVRFIQMRESVGRFEMLAVPPYFLSLSPVLFFPYFLFLSHVVSPLSRPREFRVMAKFRRE